MSKTTSGMHKVELTPEDAEALIKMGDVQCNHSDREWRLGNWTCTECEDVLRQKPVEQKPAQGHTPSMRQIPGYAGYEATDTGAIWSIGSNWRGHGGRVIQPELNQDGYHSVRVYRDGKRVRKSVHNLIALAFLGPKPSEQHEVRHINGNKLDNRVSNLAWGTRQDNADDREKHGRTSRGEKHSKAIKAGLAKSTPGPWRVEVWDYPDAQPPHKELNVQTHEILIATCNWDEGQENPYTVQNNEAQANACLIAAAPDLLAAMRSLVNHYELPESHRNENSSDLWEACEAAIAKAEGRAQ